MARHYWRLPTEALNPAARRLDTLGPLQLARLLNREDRKVPVAVGRQARQIARAVETVVRALRSGGRLIFIGAGTSGRLGVMEAAECPPTFGTPPGLVRAVMCGGPSAVFRSKEGAEDDARKGALDIRRLARRGDAVVGIAASGVTPYVLGALRAASRAGCKTILVTSNHKPALSALDIVIAPRVGPEVLAGSTRMKSGTAAKLVLNTLTTASMVRLGKAYGNRMVDVVPLSRKLRARALRLVCELGGVAPARGRRLLASTRGRVKEAILMARKGLSRAEALARLTQADGFLRRALE